MITKKPGTEASPGESKKTRGEHGCCMGTTSCSTKNQNLAIRPNTQPATVMQEQKKGPKTRILVKYDVGFSNTLYLRGKGANLSWDKGVSLKNIKADEWVWETDNLFTTCEFKVLINDKHYETGNNHQLACGESMQYTPKF